MKNLGRFSLRDLLMAMFWFAVCLGGLRLLMPDNLYGMYLAVMLLIGIFAAAAIASLNFALATGKEFVRRDWRYRCQVLLVAAAMGAVPVLIVIHWLMTPDS